MEKAQPPLKESPNQPTSTAFVTWDGPDDEQNPKSWSRKRKWTLTLIVSCFNFISPVSSSMISPALPAIGRDLNITNSSELALTLSIFVLAYAIGPLFLAPISEILGRAIVLQLANGVYIIFNTCCGFAKSEGEMIGFRVLAGLGGSAAVIAQGMSISGLLGRRRARTRIEYLLARTNARAGCWADHQGIYQRVCIVEVVLWTTSLTAVVVQIAAFFLLAETYGPRILGKKAHRLRKETGDLRLRTEFEAPDETIGVKLRGSLVRPFRLLGTQLVIQILSLYMAYLYGMVYLLLSTFPTLWTGVYGETTSIGSLNNISLAVGCYIGSQLAAHLNDRLYVRFQNHTGETGRPEFRVLFMAVGAFLVPAGLFVYGWTAWARTHWIGPNIGAAVFSAGVMVNFQRIQVYVVDAYQAFAASALAAIAVLRSIAGFGFPLFAPRLFETLGYEWGTSVLGFPTPALLGFYGQWLRERSKYAAG